jgi:hypothetical protein
VQNIQGVDLIPSVKDFYIKTQTGTPRLQNGAASHNPVVFVSRGLKYPLSDGRVV